MPKKKKTARRRYTTRETRRRSQAVKRALISALIVAVVASTVYFLVLRNNEQISIAENGIGSLFTPVQSFFSNAAGGVNLEFSVGDLMIIEDHINFMGRNPLTGPNDEEVGPRFCDMTFAYTPALRELALKVAAEQGVAVRTGVYLGYMGPSYETPAEIRAFRTLGADAVGMSTVPEVIAASHCGLPVLAISLITNMAAGIEKKKLSGDEVIAIADRRAQVLQDLVQGVVAKL